MKFGTLVRLASINDADASFRKLVEAGFDSCQLVYKPAVYDINEAAVIREAAQKYGVEISAFFAGYIDGLAKWDLHYDYRIAGLNSPAFGAERLKYVLSALPFIHKLGVTDVIVHAGFVPNNPFAPEYADMLCMVRILADKAKQLDMNVLFETGGESPITLLRLIKEVNTGNLFVNMDTGNLIMYGYGNPCEAVITLGQYIRNIHAKDGTPPTDPYKLGKETKIGEGVVDFRRFFTLLKKTGYDRFITIEREITGEEQLADIQSGMRYLKDILETI